jgi:hypothetical protein
VRNYFYRLLREYVALFVLPQNSVVEIDPMSARLVASMPNGRVAFRQRGRAIDEPIDIASVVPIERLAAERPDYIVLGGLIHYERDIQGLLAEVHRLCRPDTRVILTYYSSLWRPLANLASRAGGRRRLPESNWLAHEDVRNLLQLENFEPIRLDSKVLLPIYIPLVSTFINRFIAPLPFFRQFALVNIMVARPLFDERGTPSVSVVVPARNEAGNIDAIVDRIPRMGPDDEIIFVEGQSTDDTWAAIQRVHAARGAGRHIVICQQEGKGKGDAVRKGFSLARNEILMILDADMTVPPEDLPKLYRAIVSGKGEFINGSRLVYPMEKEAMRFLNLLGNKFFATAFSFVLGQRFKDTLCGTKVLTRTNYLKLAANRSYFGDFDPFGDFDLIFGASRMGLKIVEVPIAYAQRTYGVTNISRWRHGTLLLAMLVFAARRMKFL